MKSLLDLFGPARILVNAAKLTVNRMSVSALAIYHSLRRYQGSQIGEQKSGITRNPN